MSGVNTTPSKQKNHNDLFMGLGVVFIIALVYYIFIYNSVENKALRAITAAVNACNLAIASNKDSDYTLATSLINEANTKYADVLTKYKALVLPVNLSAAGNSLNALSCQFHAINTAAISNINDFSKEWSSALVNRQAAADRLQQAIDQYAARGLPVDQSLIDAHTNLVNLTAPQLNIKMATTANAAANTKGSTSTSTSTQSFISPYRAQLRGNAMLGPTNMRLSGFE